MAIPHLTSGSSMNNVAIPVERFKKFWAAVKAKKYRWYKPDDDGETDDKETEKNSCKK